MNYRIQEACTLKEHYRVLQREIAIEGTEQLATIARVMKHNIPLTIEILNRTIELERLVPDLLNQIKVMEGLLYAGESNGNRSTTAYTASV